MWHYVLRRFFVMIPTLFGVTIVSFSIMQLAPGDPLLGQLAATGMAGQSSQTRAAYLIQKRDLKLDKPLLLNFDYFKDFSEPIRAAAHYGALSPGEIEQELRLFWERQMDWCAERRLAFVRRLGIDGFEDRLANPEQHPRLAQALRGYVQIYLENTGIHGVPAAIQILESNDAHLRLKVGTVRALAQMVVEPFTYAFGRDKDKADATLVMATWRTWWERAQGSFPEIDPERRKVLQRELEAMASETSRSRLLERMENFDPSDMPFFATRLLDDSPHRQKVLAAQLLRLHIGKPLKVDVPRDAGPEQLRQVLENWLAHYEARRSLYEPSFLARLLAVFSDTQYAHMVRRLFTFDFGRSALKTREPVSEKIWNAVVVSAPLMVLAQLVIYFLAVPLGILCAVKRGSLLDRLVTFKLFLLYSIPPFVAGMLFLLFLCYGDYLKVFPMSGLHSEGAEEFGLVQYVLDYLWHAVLPVTCLALFSLAGLAMYARSSMLEAIGQDFIRTARAKGLSEAKVVLKHAARNALIPIITLFSNFLPAMLGGSVLIEVLFGIPGMGRLSWASIEQKDFPTLMALIYIDAIVVMVSILLSDLLYVLVDPRISFEAEGTLA